MADTTTTEATEIGSLPAPVRAVLAELAEVQGFDLTAATMWLTTDRREVGRLRKRVETTQVVTVLLRAHLLLAHAQGSGVSCRFLPFASARIGAALSPEMAALAERSGLAERAADGVTIEGSWAGGVDAVASIFVPFAANGDGPAARQAVVDAVHAAHG